MLSLPSAWVRSLGGELISHKPHSTAKKKKKKIRKTRRTVLVQKMGRWKVQVFLLGACASGQFCEKNQNGTPWPRNKHVQGEPGGAGVIGALRVRTWEAAPLRGRLHPSRLWALEIYTSHTLVYTSSHLSRIPIRSPSVAVVHTLESMNLDVRSTLLVTSAQTSYLASLWVSVSLRASKRAECGAWCALVVGGRGGERTQDWGRDWLPWWKERCLNSHWEVVFSSLSTAFSVFLGEGNLAGWLGDRVSQRKSGREPPGQASQEEQRKLAHPRTALLSPSKGRQSSRRFRKAPVEALSRGAPCRPKLTLPSGRISELRPLSWLCMQDLSVLLFFLLLYTFEILHNNNFFKKPFLTSCSSVVNMGPKTLTPTLGWPVVGLRGQGELPFYTP